MNVAEVGVKCNQNAISFNGKPSDVFVGRAAQTDTVHGYGVDAGSLEY